MTEVDGREDPAANPRQIEDQMKQAQAELGPSIDNYNKK